MGSLIHYKPAFETYIPSVTFPTSFLNRRFSAIFDEYLVKFWAATAKKIIYLYRTISSHKKFATKLKYLEINYETAGCVKFNQTIEPFPGDAYKA
jgi:hypothetical protein